MGHPALSSDPVAVDQHESREAGGTADEARRRLAEQLIQALRLRPRERPRAHLRGAAGVLVGVPHVQAKAALEVGDDLSGGHSRR
jgi:hypothetical protein